jgi:hypothetical protein
MPRLLDLPMEPEAYTRGSQSAPQTLVRGRTPCHAWYQHGRQLIKPAGTNSSRLDTGQTVGRGQRMSRRGRAGLREVLYLATLSCLQHNLRIRAHYDRLVQRADRPLPKMQALGACMNKLLLYAFAVMSRREAIQLDHHWQRTLARGA